MGEETTMKADVAIGIRRPEIMQLFNVQTKPDIVGHMEPAITKRAHATVKPRDTRAMQRSQTGWVDPMHFASQ